MTTDFFEGNEINRWSVTSWQVELMNSGRRSEAHSLPSRANQACIW